MARNKKSAAQTDNVSDLTQALEQLKAEFETITLESTMTKAKKPVSNITDKLDKVNENFTVYMYDNGFMIEISGRDKDQNYKTVKLLCRTPEEMHAHIVSILDMERDE
jgi:hypothetical protein